MNLTYLEGKVIDYRRYFHQHPELSNEEHETRKFIMNELESLGYNCISYSGRDIVIEISGEKSGKTAIIRADMDALPVTEDTGLSFSSKNDGIMHACGHDGHMAVLLGLVHYFHEHKEEIEGTIRFLFQHAEEVVPSGALEVIKNRGLEGASAIFGFHLWEPLGTGLIGMRSGATMAGCSKFVIDIQGKGGHGSMPNETIDPTIIVAEFIMQLQTIVSRVLHPLENAVISIGEIQSGSSYNIIPDSARISGTVRQFDTKVLRKIHSQMDKILEGLCHTSGASYVLDFDDGDPPLINDENLYELVKETAHSLFDKEVIKEISPILGSEDFSNYTMELPGMYIYFGVGKPDKTYGHHHPKFDIDEEMLVPAMNLLSQSVINYLRS